MEMKLLEEYLHMLEEVPEVPAAVWRELLRCNGEDAAFISARARAAAEKHYGTGVYVRALVEISSYCRRACRYCGLRCSNGGARRYRMTHEEIMDCCRGAAAKGFSTFVLQGGEDVRQNDEWLASLVAGIKAEFPDKAVTLSVGERPASGYAMLRAAGADRYLLRHETADSGHYAELHPSGTTAESRQACLFALKELGYQVGSGFMVGSPGQTAEHIVKDLMFLDRLQPQMIGVGPFIPASGTPFAGEKAGDVELTLLLISLLRLRFGRALIPATTALATLHPEGTLRGILAGANVVMPNVTPECYRRQYTIYDNKKSCGAESIDGLACLESGLRKIGYHIDFGRGDYKK